MLRGRKRALQNFTKSARESGVLVKAALAGPFNLTFTKNVRNVTLAESLSRLLYASAQSKKSITTFEVPSKSGTTELNVHTSKSTFSPDFSHCGFSDFLFFISSR